MLVSAPLQSLLWGRCGALSDKLHWAEDRQLGGRQFLLTRPRQNMSSLAGQLRDLGAQVIEMPAIHTEEICPNESLKAALERFRQHGEGKWLVFTSPIGVNVFFDTLKEMKMDLRSVLGGNRKSTDRSHRIGDRRRTLWIRTDS